jgi:hypothetical protein
MGLLIHPIERLISFGILSIISPILRKLKLIAKFPLFTYRKFTASNDYVELLAWFSTNQAEKRHWEWELFNYDLYWNIFTSLIFFIAISCFIVTYKSSVIFYGLILHIIMFMLFALSHNNLMAKVHNYYKDRMKENAVA